MLSNDIIIKFLNDIENPGINVSKRVEQYLSIVPDDKKKQTIYEVIDGLEEIKEEKEVLESCELFERQIKILDEIIKKLIKRGKHMNKKEDFADKQEQNNKQVFSEETEKAPEVTENLNGGDTLDNSESINETEELEQVNISAQESSDKIENFTGQVSKDELENYICLLKEQFDSLKETNDIKEALIDKINEVQAEIAKEIERGIQLDEQLIALRSKNIGIKEGGNDGRQFVKNNE